MDMYLRMRIAAHLAGIFANRVPLSAVVKTIDLLPLRFKENIGCIGEKAMCMWLSLMI